MDTVNTVIRSGTTTGDCKRKGSDNVTVCRTIRKVRCRGNCYCTWQVVYVNNFSLDLTFGAASDVVGDTSSLALGRVPMLGVV